LPPLNRSYTEEDVYRLLDGTFKDVFADLVILTGIKPAEVLFELEAVLSHLAVSKLHPEEAQKNVDKAMNHMQRASLDAAKMLYITFVRRIANALPEKPEHRRYVLNCGDSEFIRLVTKAEELGLNARRIELQNMGRNPNEALDPYYDAATAMRDAYLRIDPDKSRTFLPLSTRFFVEQHWVGFLLGVASSAVVAVASWLLIPTN